MNDIPIRRRVRYIRGLLLEKVSHQVPTVTESTWRGGGEEAAVWSKLALSKWNKFGGILFRIHCFCWVFFCFVCISHQLRGNYSPFRGNLCSRRSSVLQWGRINCFFFFFLCQHCVSVQMWEWISIAPRLVSYEIVRLRVRCLHFGGKDSVSVRIVCLCDDCVVVCFHCTWLECAINSPLLFISPSNAKVSC